MLEAASTRSPLSQELGLNRGLAYNPAMFKRSCMTFGAAALLTLTTCLLDAQSPQSVLEQQVRADMNFLASDALQGRGSATRDEHIAAQYAAAVFQEIGLQPGNNGSYLQKAPVELSDRAKQRIEQRYAPADRFETWNAVAILPGTDPKLKSEVILLTAHLDHLGIAKQPVNGDAIYNGADDDASGTTAVLNLARYLAHAKPPKRTVVFALFGAEEFGGLGSQAFLAHPPIPLTSIVANLEFEMIGRSDSAVPEGTLWLTGFERSTLGLELAKHGAHLVQDPHPKENFFMRSDNYGLALEGIIAHTVSSYGLHTDYHQVTDEVTTIDFKHMTTAIASMEGPVEWLIDTNWKPMWNPGGKPEKKD